MADMVNASIVEHFQTLEDPRIARTKKHPLLDILVIAVCTLLGSVANFAHGTMKGQLPLSVGGITRPGNRTVRPQCGPRLWPPPPSVFS